MPTKLICPVCFKEFRVKPSEAPRRTYCSRECMSKAYNKNIERTCEICAKKFFVPNNKYRQNAKFCSKECMGKGMSGENHPNFIHGYGNKGAPEQRQQWYKNHREKPENVSKWNERVRRYKLKAKGIMPGHTPVE